MLEYRGSNPNKRNQNPLCYHYTILQNSQYALTLRLPQNSATLQLRKRPVAITASASNIASASLSANMRSAVTHAPNIYIKRYSITKKNVPGTAPVRCWEIQRCKCSDFILTNKTFSLIFQILLKKNIFAPIKILLLRRCHFALGQHKPRTRLIRGRRGL